MSVKENHAQGINHSHENTKTSLKKTRKPQNRHHDHLDLTLITSYLHSSLLKRGNRFKVSQGRVQQPK